MTQSPERLSHLFKLPAQRKIARDFLKQKLRDSPAWTDGYPSEALESLAATDSDAHALAVWCLERLSTEQMRLLQKVLRIAANHQRVNKRTVMLSPRAHLLVKTLAEQEGLKMSDVIELHLDGVLQQRFGLTLRTAINEHTGQVDHGVVPIAGEA